MTKPLPAAVPDCLLGLYFFFMGELLNLSREDTIDIAKRFCGCVHPKFFCCSSLKVTAELAMESVALLK
ncbi:hypothetical protein EDB87DRAFT_1608667 [Lactarius vividus]|nr:hypothetical protein EDB87DRAFT_1608667 [Lactarius vividus]